MSTKCSLKWKEQTDGAPGYHLYDDALDDFSIVGEGEPPVYLRLDGVHVELETLDGGGASVTFSIPRATARELGLLQDKIAA